jgi:hypothetical protein
MVGGVDSVRVRCDVCYDIWSAQWWKEVTEQLVERGDKCAFVLGAAEPGDTPSVVIDGEGK